MEIDNDFLANDIAIYDWEQNGVQDLLKNQNEVLPTYHVQYL